MSGSEKDDVRQRLAGWIGVRLERDPSSISGAVDLYQAGYVDSLSAAELLLHVSQSYEVEVSEFELATELKSLDKLSEHIAAALRAPR